MSGLLSIRQVLEGMQGEGSLDALEAALVAREEERVGHLLVIAARHQMNPAVVAKVILDLELGAPKTEVEAAMVNHQFETTIQQMKQAFSQATGIPMEALVFPPTGIVEEDQ